MNTVKDRLIKFIGHLEIGQGKFEKLCRLSNGFVSNIKDGFSTPNLTKIALACPDLNLEWLITGKGSMLKNTEVVTLKDTPGAGAIPYYSDLPVSAGEKGLAGLPMQERPSGWIQIPGVEAGLGAFPVVGCSMEPDIFPGDFIAISIVNNWERVDPDKTYLIITLDERMIKHLMIDNEDDNILWCISPNYPKFKIYKAEIRFIYKITFHGKIM